MPDLALDPRRAKTQDLGLDAAGRTHPGRRRPHNEDAFLCDAARGRFAVIDGIGGEAAGEVAAGLAKEWLARGGALPEALRSANAEIQQLAAADPARSGMGCVATAVQLTGKSLQIAHVGDTRAYLASSAGCEQLTQDHTTVAEMREQASLTEEQARQLPGQHRVTRDLGGAPLDEDSWIDRAEVPVEAGDLLLLCSDGLHDLVREGELSRLLVKARAEGEPAARLADRLVELALERGAPDNVTVIAVRFLGGKAAGKPAPGAAGRGLLRRLLGLGAVLVLVALAGVLGRLSAPEPPPLPPPLAVAGVLAAAEQGIPGVLAGPAGLAGTLAGGGAVAALGPLEAELPSSTILDPGSSLALRGAELRFPEAGGTWRLELGEKSSVTLRQAALRAPALTLEVVLGPGSALEVIDSALEIARLVVSGATDARVRFSGIPPQIGEVQASGPLVEGLRQAAGAPALRGER